VLVFCLVLVFHSVVFRTDFRISGCWPNARGGSIPPAAQRLFAIDHPPQGHLLLAAGAQREKELPSLEEGIE
jgi:hypothetical protein